LDLKKISHGASAECADQPFTDRRFQRIEILKDTINPESQDDLVRAGIEVDVGGMRVERIEQQGIRPGSGSRGVVADRLGGERGGKSRSKWV
jgi:hypothetical protein